MEHGHRTYGVPRPGTVQPRHSEPSEVGRWIADSRSITSGMVASSAANARHLSAAVVGCTLPRLIAG
jgi:hypothetical protein